MEKERIDPLFFGAHDRRLFGCHHGPVEGAPAKLGLVIAPALGHEYSRAHRALRQLAARCASNGMRALRFDFSSTGDSAGEAWPTSLETWRMDIESALRELTLRTRVTRTALLGVRVSANLALDCAARNPSCSALVLWEPCLAGAAYVHSLAQLKAEFEASLPAPSLSSKVAYEGLECLGFRWPAALLEELRAWHGPRFEGRIPARILILESLLSPSASELAADLTRLGARVSHELSSGTQPWNADVDEGLVPGPELRRIVDFLREEA